MLSSATGSTAAIHVIVNGRASGIGDADGTLEGTLALIGEHGFPARGAVTQDLGELAAAVAATGGRGRVVLIGGDGTLHAFANLSPPLPEVALLPAGRANNIARALGIPAGRAAAAALAVTGAARPVDALAVETPATRLVALEAVSAGFHAAARHRYAAENSAALVAGARAFLRELAAYRPFVFDVHVDGVPLACGPAAQLFLANLPWFAFGFHVDPAARVDDGLLEAIVLPAANRRTVVRTARAAHAGRHLDAPGVRWVRGGHAEVRSRQPLVADAQPLGVTTASVTALPGHLNVVAP